MSYSFGMPHEKKDQRSQLDLEAEALAALELARSIPPGPERSDEKSRDSSKGD
jgi:hypothetical protein